MSKSSDQGWFYHAPPKQQQKERVFAPPPSQIPGLSDVSQLPPEPVSGHMYIRESDSKYIRLAKQGGRPDLLVMRESEPSSSEPVGYPRCEWYYDNVQPAQSRDNRPNEPYQFMLPDYMVHMPRKSAGRTCANSADGESNAERTPYAYNTETVYEREGCQATDKTVKLDEDRPSGYGVRCERQQKKQSKKSSGAIDDVESNHTVPRTKQILWKPEEEKVAMKTLMSFGYAGDYETQKTNYQEREAAKNRANEQQQQTKLARSSGHPPTSFSNTKKT